MATDNNSPSLPDLRTREEVQGYLRALSSELHLSLSDPNFAAALDSRDQLARFKDKFIIPKIGELLEGRPKAEDVDSQADCLYFNGHGLGVQPKATQQIVIEQMNMWAKKGLYSQKDGKYPWLKIEDFVEEESARLLGAKPIETVVMNTLTINCHLATVSFYRPTPQRYKILLERNAFPSDHYAVESQIRWHGYDPQDAMILLEPREGEMIWRNEDILKVIEEHGDTIAFIWLSGIHFVTGYVFDMKAITEAGHRKGCNVGFDLAHAVGNIELQLHEWEVDVAAWCTYKYLNSGPGSLGGLFVHEKHAYDFDRPRLLGWWAHKRESRFDMTNVLDLQPGAAGFTISTPPLLSFVGIIASFEIFKETSMAELRCKSRLLTGYLELLIEENLISSGEKKNVSVSIVTPKELQRRGCHLAISFSSRLKELEQFISQRGAVVDYRPPNIMRITPVPLYSSFSDVQKMYCLLQEALNKL